MLLQLLNVMCLFFLHAYRLESTCVYSLNGSFRIDAYHHKGGRPGMGQFNCVAFKMIHHMHVVLTLFLCLG